MSTVAAVGGSIAGAGIGAAASASAANTEANAALKAQEIQAQEAQNALNFQEQQYNTEQKQIAPYISAGTGALNTLNGLIPQLNQAGANYPQFQAPTAQQAQQTPGYQFALQQGEGALQNSAAAQGGLLTGNTAEAINNYAQNAADTNYQNVYNNALNTYNTQYNQFQQQQANEYNRYASLAGVGQQAVQSSTAAGQAAANNTSTIDLNTGQQQGQDIQNAGYATASGYMNEANAVNGGISNISQLSLMKQLGLLGGQSNADNVGGAANLLEDVWG